MTTTAKTPEEIAADVRIALAGWLLGSRPAIASVFTCGDLGEMAEAATLPIFQALAGQPKTPPEPTKLERVAEAIKFTHLTGSGWEEDARAAIEALKVLDTENVKYAGPFGTYQMPGFDFNALLDSILNEGK